MESRTGKLVLWVGFHHPADPNHSTPAGWKPKTLVTRYGVTKQEARELAQKYKEANNHIKGVNADWTPYPESLLLD